MEQRTKIHITGVVQGVGFRPFVYNLARKYRLKGYCLNDSGGVIIEVHGNNINEFVEELTSSPPPLSRIETVTLEQPGRDIYKDFSIRKSVEEKGRFVLISPDICTCKDCRNELFDPEDRRYLYPFINCTNCGPRYSIVKDIPYDRPKTTMSPFRLCGQCEREYHSPADRRFHAQPNACPKCGPKVWLTEKGKLPQSGKEINYPAIEMAQRLLKEGAIIAIKGLGGFHLACDAANEESVNKLRERKRRSVDKDGASNKPFALMAPDLDRVKTFCEVSEDEASLIKNRVRPIVILQKKLPNAIAGSVAPYNNNYGVMLPYTPLHYLLFAGVLDRFTALVMTSGNLSEEPIVISNEEAVKKLSGIADFFLLHNREIYMRVDDSIARVRDKKARLIRRARGFTPGAIPLGEEMEEVLAFGAELKSTFAITKGGNAIVSQHLGDLENFESLEFFKETLRNIKKTFRANPRILAHDMHPDYLSTKFALEYAEEERIPGEEIIKVQHHHAHIVSCMADNGIKNKVIGAALDGTGYGLDGNIWGGEFLTSDRKEFKREAHFAYVPMPGGEKAIREPWRMGVSYLIHAYGSPGIDLAKKIFKRVGAQEIDIVSKMITAKFNCPLTSSAGRLFDAVASLIGLRDRITFEAEAAIGLETIAEIDSAEAKEIYPFEAAEGEPMTIDFKPLIKAVIDDMDKGLGKPVISGRFHHTVAEAVLKTALMIKEKTGLNDVALSGGVFQNNILSKLAEERLRDAGFKVWSHERVPANDGGISLGQAVIAWERVKG